MVTSIESQLLSNTTELRAQVDLSVSSTAAADALYDSYQQLLDRGRAITPEEISRDVNRLFSVNFNDLLKPRLSANERGSEPRLSVQIRG
jgi:hypothetical protein